MLRVRVRTSYIASTVLAVHSRDRGRRGPSLLIDTDTDAGV